MDTYLALVDIGTRIIRTNRSLGNSFHPHCLPYTGYRSVPDAAGYEALFAAGLPALVGCVQNLNLYFLLSALAKEPGYIIREWGITSGMNASLDSVYPHFRLPVHRTEVKQDLLAFPCTGHGESAGIPQRLVNSNSLLYSGQGRFNCERNGYLSVRSGVVRILVQDGVVPLPVEVLPCAANHLRAGILGEWSGRVDFGGPTGLDRGLGECCLACPKSHD